MNQSTSPLLESETNVDSLGIRQNLRSLDRKNWWHWWNTVLVIMLLMGGISALSLPGAFGDRDFSAHTEIQTAVRGLLGLVLIFSFYMLYQQHILGRMRTQLSSQVEVVVEQRARAQAAVELSVLDSLTELYNWRFGEKRLRTEIARAEREDYPLVLLLLDLDDFKGIGERYGESAGDRVMEEFGRRLKNAIRGSDLAVRKDEAEFLVILPECPEENVGIVLARIQNFQVEIGPLKIPVIISSGWALLKKSETAEQFVMRADKALYANKAKLSTRANENSLQA